MDQARTGDLPCDVDDVLSSVCQHCHSSPPRNGAPFPLVTYADTQAKIDGRPVYEYMAVALEMGRMPLPPKELTADERRLLLDWTKAGAPPREAGTLCTIVLDASAPPRDAAPEAAAVDAQDAGDPDADMDAGTDQ